jgi:subtilisin family serine protease
MKRSLALVAAAITLIPMVSSAAFGNLFGQNGIPSGLVPNQYIVTLKPGNSPDAVGNDIANKAGGSLGLVFGNALNGFSVTLPDVLVEKLHNDPRVESVTQDHYVSANAFSSQAVQTLPTGINRINAEFKANKGTGVKVAVLDTGISKSHPDLKGNLDPILKKDCTSMINNPDDNNGHGSHVSGTIAAIENSEGVVGGAPKVTLVPVQVLDAGGSGTWSSVICGIDYVTANAGSIKVASMSLGGGGTDDGNCGKSNGDLLHQAICRSVAAGVTYVIAAGNEGTDIAKSVPASYDEVITVSALADSNGLACGGGAATSYGADDTFASFSNYATTSADLAHMIGAPGVNIYSTWKGSNYNTISGTSMATPHVSAAAALYISTHPGATPAQVRDALRAAGEPANVNFNNECANNGKSHTADAKHPEPVLRADSL